jgi:uncharacterized protein YbjT (DUF2867 family)
MSNVRILVTGAGGKTGRAVVAALQQRGVAAIRAFVRRHETLAGCELFVGDMLSESAWDGALAGIDSVYHICPNMHPQEVQIGRSALLHAQKHGISHFVYHSVLHPQAEQMPHHWHKLRVEEMVFASDLPFTILQPTAYMQNLRAQWRQMIEEGVLALPYPPETRLSLVDIRDVAEVAATVLTEAGHTGAAYELVGSAPLSQTEIAEVMGAEIGRVVAVREIPLKRWQQDARAAGLEQYAVDTLTAMFRYYAEHGLIGNAFVLGALLGRVPTSLRVVVCEWLLETQG